MCGICGIYSFDKKTIDKNQLKKMNDSMDYRGPDDEGYFIKENFGMAMKRLSIIDLKNGQQPFFSKNKKVSLIFNGEIYNYIELRNDLIKIGYKFYTSSDTEVLLTCYLEYGDNFVNMLNGMFSICIFDERVSRKILIFRDRFGIKPLYYFKSNKILIFASDLNCFKYYLKDINKSQKNFLNYLFLNYFPDDKTVYEDIHKLLPSHYIVIDNDKFAIKKYWDLKESKGNYINKNFQEDIYNVLKNSISINLRSDVEVGTLLSSGIDSSILSFEVSKNINNQKTFCAHFSNKKDNEDAKAIEFSKFINSKHSTIDINDEKYNLILENICKKIDEPHGDTSIIPTYEISNIARKNNIKVLLSGAGGDELFGGYKRHYKFFKDYIIGILGNIRFIDNQLIKLIPYKLQSYIYKIKSRRFAYAMDTSGQNLGIICDFLNDKIFKEYLCEEISQIFKNISNSIYFNNNEILFNDLSNYLPNNILSPFDKVTMLNSVEGRVPILDHRILEIINANNFNVVNHNNFKKSKLILRKIYQKKLPNFIFKNKKIGFDASIMTMKNKFSNDEVNSLNIFHMFDQKKIEKNISNENCTSFFYNLRVYSKWLRYH